MKCLKKNNAVTLIALVISIIVLIILSVVTFNLTVGKNGLITKSFEARYMMQLSSYQEELGAFKAVKFMDNDDFEESSITSGENSLIYNTQPVGEGGNIYDVITSLENSNFAGKLEIIKGEIVLNSTDETEIRAAQAVGIEVNPYIIVDGELTSSGANLALMDENGALTIPEGVTKIGKGAFANLSGLKTIIIPGTVKEIGENAFAYNVDLETVILQEGVEVIGHSAFMNCNKLKNIELPKTLLNIGSSIFLECNSLDNVKIPSKIKEISALTFYNCRGLTNIELPNGLEEIEIQAFFNCSALERIYIPKTVNNIGYGSFDRCTKLTDIEIEEGNEKYSYSKESGMLVDTTINQILFISDSVLRNITTFNMPEGITNFNIDISVYNNIKTIVIPQSLVTIGLANCFPSAIEKVVAEGNNNFVVENDCLYNENKTELIMCFTKEGEVELADTLITVSDYSFIQAVNIKNVNFPNSVAIIGSQVFSALNNKIENIRIGANVTSIDPIFKYLNYNGTITIDETNPNYSIENNELYNKDKTELLGIYHDIQGQYIVREGVTKIGNRVFHAKRGMTEIILPDSLKEISSSFMYCTGLTTIYIPNSVEKINNDAFYYDSNLMRIQIDNTPNSIEGAPWGAPIGDRAVEWLRQ